MDTQTYQSALDLLKQQDYKAAQRILKKIVQSLDEHDDQYNIVLSAYGLSQVLNANKNGLLLCRDAASNECFDGEVFLNLACAEWHSFNRKRAINAIRQGIKVDPDNAQLNNACAKLGCRKKCCFEFLPRSHKMNRMFGKLFRKPTASLSALNLLS